MARTKNHPGTAPSAPHAAPEPAPAPGTAPDPGSPAAAVHAALAANPGGTVAGIASAAGTSKPATRDTLLAMEKAGTATRAKGSRPGIPDTWTLTSAADDTGPAAADPGHEQDSQPGNDPDRPEGPGDREAAPDATASPGQQDRDTDAGAAPDPGTEQAGPRDGAPAAGSGEDAAPDGHDEEATPGGPPDADASDPREDAPADGDGEASDAPDPALVTDLTGRIDQIKAAAGAAATVLAGGGDLRPALAGLEEIHEQAAQARRSLKAAIGGRKAPAVRPGGLRDKVLAHLDENPGKEFTPHEIHKVLNHSSGAIANALETLVKLGDAEVATEKPRRFRRATQPAAATPGADGAASGQDEGTDLEGAA
jgi:hypothetical protein